MLARYCSLSVVLTACLALLGCGDDDPSAADGAADAADTSGAETADQSVEDAPVEVSVETVDEVSVETGVDTTVATVEDMSVDSTQPGDAEVDVPPPACEQGGCDDANPCTDDTCDAVLGCVFTMNAKACNDGNACTRDDVCTDGTCVGAAVTCVDGNVCTEDACDPATGCVYTPNAAACNDGDACTRDDACAFGGCGGLAVVCDDGNPCTDDRCDTLLGCVFTPNTAACDDGTICTSDDVCAQGQCKGVAVICDDHFECTDDSCNPIIGCVFTPNTAPCDDGNACTSGDVCVDNVCTAGSPVVCDDEDLCTDDRCDGVLGCVHVDASAQCNDGNGCTTDSCVPAIGCLFTPNTAPCDDGNACTDGDVCVDTVCTGGWPLICDDEDLCTDDRCDEVLGCVHVDASAQCNDGNICTTDSCVPAIGCLTTPTNAACDDGNACTADVCTGGACQYPPIVTTLLAGGVDVASQGWTTFTQQPATLTYGADYTRVATSTNAGASTSGQLLLAKPGAVTMGAAFALEVVMQVEAVNDHNQLDAGVAIMGSLTGQAGTSIERSQMVYVDNTKIGWADDSQSVVLSLLDGQYHTFLLDVGVDKVARLSVDGVVRLTRNNFTTNGTVAVGDQTNDARYDGTMRIRSVKLLCR